MLSSNPMEQSYAQPKGRILFLSSTFPYDIERSNYGIFQRMRMLLDAAAQESSVVDALFFVDSKRVDVNKGASWAELIEQHWGLRLNVRMIDLDQHKDTWSDTYLKPIFGLHHHPNYRHLLTERHVHTVVNALHPDTALVLAHRLAVGVLATKTGKRMPPIVMDLDDVEHIKFKRDLARPPHWLSKYLMYLQLPQLKWRELHTVKNCASTLVCSEKDRAYLHKLTKRQSVEVVPNGVALIQSTGRRPTQAGDERSPTVLFLGTYSYAPNVEAAETLLNKVFPQIRARIPGAQLLLVGNKIEQLPSFGSKHLGVKFLGFAEDLDSVYEASDVMCCPIQTGGGTRIKIIEAASKGLPVVSTSIGAEGLDFENDREIKLADTASDLAQACINLLSNPTQLRAMGSAAQKKSKIYDRNHSIGRLRKILKQTCTL